jgi:hypothetical protein
MVRSLGRRQFAVFWHSQQAVPDAFHSAASAGLDAWVHDWSVRTYGALAVGPGVTGSAILAGLALLIAAIVTAMLISRNRRVT